MTNGRFEKLDGSTRAIYTVLALVFLIVVGAYLFRPRTNGPTNVVDDPQKSASASSSPPGGKQTAANEPTLPPIAQSKNAQRQLDSPTASVPNQNLELRITTAENEQLKKLIVELANRVLATAEKLGDLSSTLNELETNDEGRKHGNDPKVIRSLVIIQETASTLREDFESLRSSIDIFTSEVLKALESNPTETIPEKIKSRRRDLSNQLGNVDRAIGNNRDQLRSTFISLPKSKASSIVLRDAIKNLHEEEEKAFVVARDAERSKQLHLRIDAIGKSEHETELAALDAKASKARDERESLLAKQKADAIVAESARQRALLEAEFQRDLPKIQHYLGPLFKLSRQQPNKSSTYMTVDEMPVSLTALKAQGMSETNVDGTCVMLLLFFSYFKTGGRGLGPYDSSYIGAALTPEQFEQVLPAYKFLQKYGDLLVEKGMLAE